MKLRRTLTLLFLPLLVLAAARSAFPQADASRRAVRADGAVARGVYLSDPAVRERARYLAAATADEARKWDDRPAAVSILSGAADLLWNDDPERAGAWLTRAWELADGMTGDEGRKVSSEYRCASSRSRARALILATARRHDKALADLFLQQLADGRGESDKERQRGIFDDRTARSEQLLNLALSIVGEDPDGAANMAERSLADGISFQLQRLLLELRARDSAAADRVFDSALARLAHGFQEASEAQVLASYLFTPGRVFSVGADHTISLAVSARDLGPGRTPAEGDPVRARRFLAVMQRVVMSLPAPAAAEDPTLRAQELFTLAVSLRGGFERYAPDLWLPVEHRLVHISPDLRGGRSAGPLAQSVKERLQSRDPSAGDEVSGVYVDALEERADKEADPVERKFAYARAALATSPEDLSRGVKIAAKISDGEFRKQVTSFLVYRAALRSLEKGRLEQAVELASGAGPLQRTIVLITAAQRMGAERAVGGDDQVATQRRQRALELLSEADVLLQGEGRPADLLRARIGLVAALAHFDVRGALGRLKSVVDDINKADSFDIARAEPPSVGLSDFTAQPSVPAIRDGYGLKDVFAPLARENFDESVYVASKLSAPPTRGVCMLEIARSILTGGTAAK